MIDIQAEWRDDRRRVALALVLLAASLAISVAATSCSLTICIILATRDRFRKRDSGWCRTGLDEPLGVLLGLSILSALGAEGPVLTSLGELGETWLWAIFYLVVWYVTDKATARRVLTALCIVGALVAVYAFVQHHTGLHLFGKALRTTSTFSAGSVRYLASGFFNHHQTFANVYLLIFSMALSLCLLPLRIVPRLLAFAGTAMLGLAVFVSYTRGVWLASLASILFVFANQNRKAFIRVMVILAVLVTVMLSIPSTYSSRARSIFDLKRNIDRLLIWETSWDMLRDHPILGIGPGMYRRHQEDYAPQVATVDFSRIHAHNSYLQLAVERGLFALAAFLWVWGEVLRTAFRSMASMCGRENFRHAAVRGATAGVIGFLIDGLFQNNYGDSEVSALVFLLAGIIFVFRNREDDPAVVPAPPGGANATEQA